MLTPKPVEGRPRVPDRQATGGILFVLHTDVHWDYLPQELGFGSGMTCWRRPATGHLERGRRLGPTARAAGEAAGRRTIWTGLGP
ncbi:transposase [Streptomyces antibioticus]